MISRKILESLSEPSTSLDPSNILGQAYDGASVMSSGKEGVQAKIKEISPLALFTHCYAHRPNLSIATSCKLSEVRNLIGLINEAYLFLNNSPKRQQLFELTLRGRSNGSGALKSSRQRHGAVTRLPHHLC